MSEPNTEDEALARGLYGIPDQRKLDDMSFAELAVELADAKKDSPKYVVVERELKRVLARDQAEINRSNVVLGALIGGTLGLTGVFIGWYLRACPVCEQIAPASTVQQVQGAKLEVQPQVAPLVVLKPIASQPANEPVTVRDKEGTR